MISSEGNSPSQNIETWGYLTRNQISQNKEPSNNISAVIGSDKNMTKYIQKKVWIKKMWHLYTMKFLSATKKNEILSFASKWMEMENIILSAVGQAQKAKCHMFSLVC
jgi:hypothetical protein